MGPPFSLLPRLRWSRARGVENPRTARLVHHINSDGPRARSRGVIVCVSLHAIDATESIRTRLLD